MAKLQYVGKGIIWGEGKSLVDFGKNGTFETADTKIQSLLKKKGFEGKAIDPKEDGAGKDGAGKDGEDDGSTKDTETKTP